MHGMLSRIILLLCLAGSVFCLPSAGKGGALDFQKRFVGNNLVQFILPNIKPGKNFTLSIDAGHIRWTDNVTIHNFHGGNLDETSLESLNQSLSKQGHGDISKDLITGYETTLKEVQGLLQQAHEANSSKSLVRKSPETTSSSTSLQMPSPTHQVRARPDDVYQRLPLCLGVLPGEGRGMLLSGLLFTSAMCGITSFVSYPFQDDIHSIRELDGFTAWTGLISALTAMEAFLLIFIPVMRSLLLELTKRDPPSYLALFLLNSPMLQLATRTAALLTKIPRREWSEVTIGDVDNALELGSIRQTVEAFSDPRRPGWETLAASRWARTNQAPPAVSPPPELEMAPLNP